VNLLMVYVCMEVLADYIEKSSQGCKPGNSFWRSFMALNIPCTHCFSFFEFAGYQDMHAKSPRSWWLLRLRNRKAQGDKLLEP